MTLTKKLQLLIFSLLLVFTLLLIELFQLAKKETAVQKGEQQAKNIGHLSRVLTAVQEKYFTILWNEGEQKNIPLSAITSSHFRRYTETEELGINFGELKKIVQELSPEIKKDPINAQLKYGPASNKVTEFALSQNGRRLNVEKTVHKIALALAQAQLTAMIAVEEIPPEITENSLIQLGITALLAKGESDFVGSSSNRVHNIKIGSAKFNGLLLKPGEEFSFNQILGEVDAKEGYRSELVIKSGKLVPEYGGGLCQVSTTLFRAAINSGVPILERKPHSFPVRYYNPQGFDATIYPGITDLRFKNDTSNHILIQSRIEETKLVFEIFGSSDNRTVEVDGPKVLEQNSNGSMKTVLNRKIIATDGTTKEESFWSNYKSPAAFPLQRNPLE